MYIDQDSLGNDVNMFADNVPNCDNCALAAGLPVTTPMLVQEELSEVPEKNDKEINITKATAIKVVPETAKLQPGGAIKLELGVEPTTANAPDVVWETSDMSVAFVTADGIVYAQKVGEVDITATSPLDNTVTASCTVTVESGVTPPKPEDVPVTKITLTPATKSLNKGATFTPTVAVEPEDATNKEVTGVAAGVANITATAKDGSGITGKCKVTVNPTKVTNITITQTEISVEVGKSAIVAPSVIPDDADNKELDWSSDHPEFATVGNITTTDATINGVAEGTAIITITAKDGSGVSATITVTVTAAAE